ncbi:MAG: AAA family ATPase [Planctomycetes bacterium]|nr:AAA family ATPase [Planctomycetota bacterium]
MSHYHYVDDASRPFVAAVAPQELALADALETVAAAFPSEATFRWTRSRSFYGGDLSLLPQGHLQSSSLHGALLTVEEHQTAAVFILAAGQDELDKVSRPLERQLTATVEDLTGRRVPGKRLILVTAAEAKAWLKNLQPGKGRFEAVHAAPAPAPTAGEFESAVKGNPPDGGEWGFADAPKWAEKIESLTEEEIAAFVKQGLHLYSVRRLQKALMDVKRRFVGRDDALEMMVACALARTNLVFLGPPGTAKSLLVRTFARALGIRPTSLPIDQEEEAVRAVQRANRAAASERRLFEYLLTRYTSPEEIFGGADINLLLATGVHARRTAGMLPRAEIAFLDEIFKANSAILNTLLSLTNERLFYNMGQAFRVNLVFAVGASNETPDSEELGALYDRFPIRVVCHPVPDDPEVIKTVIRQAHGFECAEQLKGLKKETKRVPRSACLNDIRFLSKVVLAGLYGGTEAFESDDNEFPDQFVEMFLTLRREFGVSDRTPAQVLRICRALALLETEGPAHDLRAKHLRAWSHVAPTTQAAADLQRVVQAKIQVYDRGAVK